MAFLSNNGLNALKFVDKLLFDTLEIERTNMKRNPTNIQRQRKSSKYSIQKPAARVDLMLTHHHIRTPTN